PEIMPGNQELKSDLPGGRDVRATLLSQSVVWLRRQPALCLSVLLTVKLLLLYKEFVIDVARASRPLDTSVNFTFTCLP
ncbi:MAG: hypothetical protein ACRD4B_07355, partial [Acidobacteriota bacterium]